MKIDEVPENELAKNKQFVQNFKSENHPNPLGKGIIVSLSDKGVDAYVSVLMVPQMHSVHISEITVMEGKTGLGFGDYTMEMITKLADKMDVRLSLFAIPIKHQGKKVPKSKLKKFYIKHGFVEDSFDHYTREAK